jgi:hypothetical protein
VSVPAVPPVQYDLWDVWPTARHLAGKHDQKTHAHGASASGAGFDADFTGMEPHSGGPTGPDANVISPGSQPRSRSRVANPVDAPDGTDFDSLPADAQRAAEQACLDAGLPDIEAMTRNVEAAYGAASAQDLQWGEEFYDQAGAQVEDLSQATGSARVPLSVEQVTGITAALSPQTRWENNQVWADHAVRTIADDPVIDDAFLGQPFTVGGRTGTIAAELPSVEPGRRLSEYPEADQVQLIKLSGQHPMTATAQVGPSAGQQVNANYVVDGSIAKAVQIARGDGTLQSVSSALGGHKVRSFYDDIITRGQVDRVVTIDAHALDAAALGTRARRAAEQVPDTSARVLTEGDEVALGIRGRGYAAVAKAYRDAQSVINDQRAARGQGPLTTAQVQAVVWMTTLP